MHFWEYSVLFLGLSWVTVIKWSSHFWLDCCSLLSLDRLVLFTVTKFSDSCLLTLLCLCNHFICNIAACLAITISLYNRVRPSLIILNADVFTVYAIHTVSYHRCVFVCLWIQWFRVFFAQLLFFTKQAVALKKKNLYCHIFWHLSSLNWYQW